MLCSLCDYKLIFEPSVRRNTIQSLTLQHALYVQLCDLEFREFANEYSIVSVNTGQYPLHIVATCTESGKMEMIMVLYRHLQISQSNKNV